jgi:hypothetical protein
VQSLTQRKPLRSPTRHDAAPPARLAGMALNKALRRWTAGLLAVVLVCLQLATAAYACAAPGTPGRNAVVMADMPDCQGMTELDDASPQLCKAHCDRDKQTVNNAPALDPLPAPVLDWLLTHVALWPAPQGAETLPAVLTAHTGPPDGTPPVYLVLQVLRN